MKKFNKLSSSKNSEVISYECKIIYAYRYISLFLTSGFYLFQGKNYLKFHNTLLVLCLALSALLLNYMYIKYKNYLIAIKVLITMETISNVVILIPTGGLNSPYIWYSLSTVLLTCYFLSSWYFYLNLLTYTTFLSILDYLYLSKITGSFFKYFSINANLALSYTLIIIAIKLLMEFDKKLNKESKNLVLANRELLKVSKLNEILLVNEEQNRIANEIHDSVSQRLFYISCKLSTLRHNHDLSNNHKLVSELNLINDVLSSAMKELRETIYNYSDDHNNDISFEKILKDYIDEVSMMNDINISFKVIGEQDWMSSDSKKVIYRIISEAIGNSIKHGKSKNIFLYLCSDKECTKLNIDDDGVGFAIEDKIIRTSKGLGIKNLQRLVNYYNGNIDIISHPKIGTSIKVEIPRENLIKEKQGEVV